jgi:transposase
MLLHQMCSWDMAKWVAFLSRYQVCRFVGGLLFLYPIVEELEVAEIVNAYCPSGAEVEHGTVVSGLVLNRLTAPRPLYKIARWMAFTILPLVLGTSAHKFNDDRLGRTLDAIEAHLQEIWIEIVIRAFEHYDIDTSVIFYDLTAFVMEGEYEDSELVDFGFAHNTPMDKRKVKLAGNATQDGNILFDWAVICGRVADTATAEGNMQQLVHVMRRQKWSRKERRLVVGDRAMLNSRLAVAYEALKQDNVYYLAGLEPRTEEHKELLRGVSLRELRANTLTGEVGHRYWGVKRPISFVYENEETGEKKEVTHIALVILSEATRRSWRRKRLGQLRALSTQLREEVKEKLNQPYWRNPETIRKRVQSRLDDSPVGKVMKVNVWGEYGEVQMRWRVDRQALRELCRLDGRYLLVTDDPTLSCKEMLQVYKNKDGLDKRFQVSKQVLRVRPIYLHKDERIEAMLLVNMIALLVYSLAERRCRRGGLEMTGREMLYEFAPLHAVETHCWDSSILYRCMPLTPRQWEILQRMGLAGSPPLDAGAWIACTPGLPPPRGQPGFWEVEQVA